MRDEAVEVQEDLQVLPAGMEDLDDGLVGQQRAQQIELQTLRQDVDDGGILGARQLNEAEFRIVGLFAQKLRVDQEVGGVLVTFNEGEEGIIIADDKHASKARGVKSLQQGGLRHRRQKRPHCTVWTAARGEGIRMREKAGAPLLD